MIIRLVCLLAAALCAVALAGGGGYAAGGAAPGAQIQVVPGVGGPSIVGGAPLPSGGVGGGAGISSPCSGASCGPDFNPALLGGNKGYPGLRARINQRAFQYASDMVGGLLNSEIKKARIPPITQCIPQVNGCIQIYNLYVSRYRCPQRVVLYPAAPNRLVLQVQNLDIGVTGNLGGQVVILVPIALFGIVQLNLHQVTVTVDLAVERTATGAPYIRVQGCSVNIGYADAYIEQGGLIGDIVNSQFRSRISGMVKEMVPGKICAQLPSIVNEKLNTKLAGLPQTIALTQMASMFGGALGLGAQPSQQFCQQSCGAQTAAVAASSSSSAVSVPAAAVPAPPAPAPVVAGPAPQAPEIPTDAYGGTRKVVRAVPVYRTNQPQQQFYYRPRVARDAGFSPNATDNAFVAVQRAAIVKQFDEALDFVGAPKMIDIVESEHTRSKRQSQLRPAPPAVYRAVVAPVFRKTRGSSGLSAGVGAGVGGFAPGAGPLVAPPPAVPGAPAPALLPNPSDACSKCPHSAGGDDPASLIRQMAAHLDLNKLNDMYLSLQLMNTYATSNDFTIDLTGEFSPYGQGGTPFGAFPTQFPSAYDNHMAEFIVTDYTLNSLFYHMHRKGFISFRIGPDTPKIGELLKTTCSEDEDEELEDHGVELDEEDTRKRKRRRHVLHDALHHIATHSVAKRAHKRSRHNGKRGRRQGDEGGLADLGICFGDILPAVREKYPNQKINIHIHTVRAPSVILSARQGGMATIDLIADADIYIDGTNTKVGTITITAVVDLIAQVQGNKISGSAQITTLQLRDQSGTLGLPQDALDNLGNLGKELLQKLANDALGKGIALNMPQSTGLPFQIINPQIQIIEHGLYIATDLTVNAAALGLGGGGGC